MSSIILFTMKNKLMVTFLHAYKTLPVPEDVLNKSVRKISRQEKNTGYKTIEVIFCSDYKIRKLNKSYRKKDKPTDVLSFPFNDTDLLGEIYLSLQRAKAQARKFGTTYNQEVNRLFVHGIFHLLGYNHHTKKDRAIMEAREALYI
jgi:probable rRNA maturation factor